MSDNSPNKIEEPQLSVEALLLKVKNLEAHNKELYHDKSKLEQELRTAENIIRSLEKRIDELMKK